MKLVDFNNYYCEFSTDLTCIVNERFEMFGSTKSKKCFYLALKIGKETRMTYQYIELGFFVHKFTTTYHGRFLFPVSLKQVISELNQWMLRPIVPAFK